MEVTLTCAVVGAAVGRVFPVRVDLSIPVGELKDRIKEAAPGLVYFDADVLNLYLAREDGRWLNDRDPDIKALVTNTIPDRIRDLMQEHLEMWTTRNLNNDEYLGKSFEPVEGDVHVLVELPEDPEEWTYYYGKRESTQDESVFAWDWPLSYLRSWFTDDQASKADKVD